MSVERIYVDAVDIALDHESVQIAAQRMHDHKVGCLVVVDDEHHPIGIVTDRDLMVRVLARGADPMQTVVRQVMTSPALTVNKETPIETAITLMRAGACRRLAVVGEDSRLCGMVSLDDVMRLIAEECEEIGYLLTKESPASLARGDRLFGTL